MKILGLVASPRKNGSTSKMVNYILEGADSSGSETEIIYLNDLKYRDCQGCYGCNNSFRCVLKDDLTRVYDAINKADEIVIGSPVYMWEGTGLFKNFIDRLLPYYNMKHKQGNVNKKVTFAYSQGSEDVKENEVYFKLMEVVIERLGFISKGTLISPNNFDRGDINKNIKLVNELKSYYKSNKKDL
jgi:multimeric flavodoxin WrbA